MNRTDFTIKAANWSDDEYSIRSIRHSVFVEEQNVPEERDFDGLDASCYHALGYAENIVVATGRMETNGHIGRIAVLSPYRGRGIGSAIMYFFMNKAKQKTLNMVYLNSQITAIKFYEKLGFHRIGDVFMDADIEHIRMEKSL